MRLFLFIFLFISVLLSTSIRAQTVGEFSIFVFESGKPVERAVVSLGDNIFQLTDKNGNAHVFVPSGIYYVEVEYNNRIVAEFELLSIAGEDTQAIASIPAPGEIANLEIESSNSEEQPQGLSDGEFTVDLGRGKLSGAVKSLKNQASLAGAQIYVSGMSSDIVTDEQGYFETELPVGVYSLSIILAGYAAVTVEGVEITKDNVTEREIELSPAGLELSEFVVLAPYIEGSVASIVQETRDSSEVKEVLGAEQMSQAGDSNAASALQRVTGLTIEEEKYVVIRGQPSRYTLSLLNNSELPSPDPIRRVVPLDLFPTDVLAGLEVQKSYSADKPGSFGGGLINLLLVGVPEESFANISIGTVFNSQSTFQEGLTYEGGSTDFLGVDDGTRAIPKEVVDATQDGTVSIGSLPREQRDELGRSFDNNYQVSESTILPDRSVSVSAGKNFKTKYGEFGLLGNFSWGQKFRHREEVNRTFTAGLDDEILVESEFDITRTDMNAGLGALLVAGGKWEKHELTSNTFFIRDTTMRTELEEGENNSSDGRYERNYLLEWNQREMQVQQFVGKHDFDFVSLDWRYLIASGNREAPDRRTYTYVRQPTGSFIFFEEAGGQRRYNTVKDEIDNWGVDLTIPLHDSKRFKSSLKTGVAKYEQDRRSDTSRFRFEPEDGVSINLEDPNPDNILHPGFIGSSISFNDDTLSNDDYNGSATVDAVYLMTDFEIKDLLRVNLGARHEEADFEVITFNSTSRGEEPIIGGFSDSNILPAATLTWFLNEEMQLRFGYGETISRPVLVELSPTLFFDPENSDVFIGNPDLLPAEISGFDLRWEWYFSTEELVSVGLFTRDYINPIELRAIPFGGNQRSGFQNAEAAEVRGLEFGGRLSLDYLGDGYYLQSNLTLLESSVTLKETGSAVNSDRPLQGQAEYVFNLQLGYDGEKMDWSVVFNQVGRRLHEAGQGSLPDIYREPTPELNSKWSWKIDKTFKFSLAATNLLDPKYSFVGAGIEKESYKKGITIKSSISAEF